MHCVDLCESFQTHIYLQNLASIQPSTPYSTFILLIFQTALKCKPEKREPCILFVLHLQSRGLVSAATFRAEVLGSELLLTGFFWSSFVGVELARFFFPRAFRLWIPKRCKGVHSFFPAFRFRIPKRCKGVHCVDLGESVPTSIYLQNLASIQPRTSLISG